MDVNIILDPFKELITIVFEYLPRVLAALVLLLVAWILAKVLRTAVRRGLAATKIDRLVGVSKGGEGATALPVSHASGTVVFWLVWLLFILAILQVLGLQGVLDSIVVVFDKIFAAVPNVIGAILILGILFLIARLAARAAAKLLRTVHFDEVPVKLGITKEAVSGTWAPSAIVGYVVIFVVMLFAVMMAADLLGFVVVNELVAEFTTFVARSILAAILLGVGIFLANVVSNMLRSGGRSPSLASAVRIFIIVFIVALALRTMGFANDIILLGFGLILGAIALAGAIAFGIGGRQAAGDLLARWTRSEKTGSEDQQ